MTTWQCDDTQATSVAAWELISDILRRFIGRIFQFYRQNAHTKFFIFAYLIMLSIKPRHFLSQGVWVAYEPRLNSAFWFWRRLLKGPQHSYWHSHCQQIANIVNNDVLTPGKIRLKLWFLECVADVRKLKSNESYLYCLDQLNENPHTFDKLDNIIRHVAP